MEKILFFIVAISFLAGGLSIQAQDDNLSSSGITPDNPFYFLKSWKENIQTFFIFNTENKAKQYLHLADVRIGEYQKMLEKGKTELAQKTLDKYERQLNVAIKKAEESKNKGKNDIIEEASVVIAKHIAVLEENLQKVPESAKKGIEKALENAKKMELKIPSLPG
ncbi:MAG: DUF5667 domain-containing protein, partial [bacterium]|nr:DUF5667 domain-containing protein [bacterium]